ncbi:MAG: ChbG/HpnK family deacetylase [Deltaproteobacteria bacterium]|nr:ChbG/HpnK family deacetylase [Deltaproteobacteria bacterium]
MIRLVVNAQEFGTTPAIDRAVIQAHRDGIVTSTSLLGNCNDLAAVRSALLEAPRLGIGVSLALVGGSPIALAADVPSLLTAKGVLRSSPSEFALDWLKNIISPLDLEREMTAQVARALDAGLAIDHLCTRHHLGFLPGVGQVVERVARRHKIPGIRSTVEPPTLSWLTDPRRGIQTGVLGGLSWLTRRRLGSLRHGPQTWGYLESGRLDEVRIVEIIGRMGPGPHELICHPNQIANQIPNQVASQVAGQVEDSVELRALTSTKVKTALERRAIVLCRWQDLF